MVILSVVLSFSSVQTKLAGLVTSKVNSKYNTSILIEKIDLSYLKEIELKNVLIKDHHLDTLIYVEKLSTSLLSLKNIFSGKLYLGEVKLEHGAFLLKTYKGEESNSITIFSRKFQNKESTSNEPFKLTAASIELKRVKFNLIDENRQDKPIVFYHQISGFFDNFRVNGAHVSAAIHDLKTVENHKINIVNFKSNFSYSNTRMEFFQTELKTKKSQIKADIVFDYKEGDLLDFTNKVKIDAKIKKADIILPDLKKLYKEFGKNDKIHFSTHAIGTINDFTLEDVNFKSDRNSSFKGRVYLKDVLIPEKFKLEANIDEVSSSYEHLVNLFPKLIGEKIPSSFEKIGHFKSRGKMFLTRSLIKAKLTTTADIGYSKVNIKLLNYSQKEHATYDGEIELVDFKLGKFVNDSLIGDFSMVGVVKGKGFNIDNISINIKGEISKHQYKGYTYSNIDINGTLKDKHFDGNLLVNDPNIKLEFKGLADLSNLDNVFKFKANVDFANFYKLNLFTRDSISVLKGNIDINFHGNNLDNIEGKIGIANASYTNQNDIYKFKDFLISSKRTDSIRNININSTDIINGSLKGNFKFNELLKLAKNSLGSLYINYKKEQVSQGQFLNFNFNIHNKIVDAFFPEIKLGANTLIKGEVNSDDDLFRLVFKSPNVDAFNFLIKDIKLQVDSKNPILNTILSVDKIDTKYYNIADVSLVNVVLNDTLFIRTNFKGGEKLDEKYDLSFYHTIDKKNQSVFGVKKSKIKFKNNIWQINPSNNKQNKVVFTNNMSTYAIDNVNIVSNNQQFINLAGFVDDKQNTQIDLSLENVNLYDVTPVIDSVKLGGKVNGTINLTRVKGKIIPLADLRINYFNVNDDYYGDLSIVATGSSSLKNYKFQSKLENSDLTSFSAEGDVDFSLKDPSIIANVAFDKFRINAFNPLGKGVLSKIRGFISGKATITGLVKNPNINGEIELEEAGLSFPYLNVNYDFLGKSVVKIHGQTFDFQTVNIEDDVKKTKGILKGSITHEEFKKWFLDLKLSTDNLLVLNTKEKEEVLYYGTGLLSGKTTIKGYTDNLKIDVVGKTNPGTEFIMPLSDVSTVYESKLIHFEKQNLDEKDEKKLKTIVFKELKGLNINFDLKVTKDAVAEVVIDKISGSILRGSADGNLKLNIDTNGKFEMNGVLVVDNGEYQFKNIVNKDFEVNKGGTIVWTGNPFNAELNITAVNHTKANPAVLLDEIASSRKIDVDLITRITGPLSNPTLGFDVQIPNSSSLVASELEFKLGNEDDMLNQFVNLLVTGSFSSVSQDKSNFDSNAAIAGTIAQKASQLISNMIGASVNENFSVGVTYDIGTTNSVKDVTTDDQLGFEVSGRIADKVIVNGKLGVPVGSNTNSSVIGEVEVVIPLNEAETFQTKVYNRQNEIQFDVVEGEGYTQGVGISYRFDFDNRKEFFEKIGLKKTEEEKILKKKKRDSIKKGRKAYSKLSKDSN